MSKQKKQAIWQMILAAILCAAVVIPGMVAVEVGRANEQAAQAAKAEQDQRALADKVAAVKVAAKAEPEQVLSYWDSVPLDKELQNYIVETSNTNGISPSVVMALICRESNYKADNIGDNGNSFGLCQIQVRWHYERMQRLGCTDLLDPYQNVKVCIDYLCELLSRYNGDMAKALTAYNRGHYNGTVTQYATSVLAQAEKLGGANVYEFRTR